MDKGTTSLAASGPPYEVFLSFRGVDTRHGFADYLYHSLVGAGVLVFRDNESLCVGKKISGELPQAIENSKIYIPILSKNYASSYWCLRELSHMVECTSKSNETKEILPIFLDVEPEDVKLKTNLYSQALLKHPENFRTEVESWKKALIEVGNMKGWNWKEDEGQGGLISSIIRTVSTKLKVAYENVTQYLVGVDDRVKAIIKMLDVGSDSVCFLGIHGMGGVGKTTLAKVVFNTLFSRFDRCCFLADVRESSKDHNGLVNLQTQLLSKLLGSHFIDQIYHVNDGINMINRGILRNKKVLIILDDVDEKEQLKYLAGKDNWFGFGSRIIITTRDQSVLTIDKQAIDEGLVKKPTKVLTYDVQEMEFGHALKLFSRHAFRRDSPPDHSVFLSKKIVRTLGKLPLALEVTGSSLHGKSKALWIDTLKKLKEAPPMEVQKKLMITYEKLDHTQRQVFLDIACFFVNCNKTYPLYMWEDCGYYPHDAIGVLFLMSLIKIKDDKTFWMHDQVRDLGREIVRQENFNNPRKRSRVWNPKQTWSILRQKEGSRKIEALSLGDHQFDEEIIIKHDEFVNLQNLRFFRGHGVSFVGDFNRLLFNIRWLSWQHCPFKFKATHFHPTNLVVLDLSSSNISEEWNGWNQLKEATKLKVLDLSYCRDLERTPDLSTWLSLERLILEGCRQLIDIDPSIGKLKNLAVLNLYGCDFLRELPEEIVCLQNSTKIVMPDVLHILPKTLGDMKSLLTFDVPNRHSSKLSLLIGVLVNIRQLDLSDCTNLSKLPKIIGRLQSLVELDISSTRIGHLPDSIGNLKQLKVLRMRNISGITKLPSAIGLVEKLEELDASACHDLTGDVPEEIGRLFYLRILDLSATRISGLPDSIGNLKQLTTLRMSHITGITKLPSAIGLMEKLEELDVSACHNLTGKIPEEIGRLSNLRFLNLSDTHISALPDSVGNLKQLKVLRMSRISGITKLPRTIGHVEKLEELDASACRNLTGKIPEEVGGLSYLRILDLSDTRISGLPTMMNRLTNLQTLKLEACPEIIRLPELPPSLTCLRWAPNTSWSSFVGSTVHGQVTVPALLPGTGVLSQQEKLDTTLLISIGTLSQLEKLTLSCKNVQFLPQLPSSLRDLELQDLATTGSPDFSNLKNLSSMKLFNCSMSEFSGIYDAELEVLRMELCNFGKMDTLFQLEMKRLRSLMMLWCDFLPEVLDLSRMKNLQDVILSDCKLLRDVRGLEELGSLCFLRVERCDSMESMSGLSKLTNIWKLIVKNCPKLRREEGLNRLECLQRVMIVNAGEFGADLLCPDEAFYKSPIF